MLAKGECDDGHAHYDERFAVFAPKPSTPEKKKKAMDEDGPARLFDVEEADEEAPATPPPYGGRRGEEEEHTERPGEDADQQSKPDALGHGHLRHCIGAAEPRKNCASPNQPFLVRPPALASDCALTD